MKKYLFIIAMFSLSIACGNNKPISSDDNENTKVEAAPVVELEKSPCDLVSDADIRKLFSIPENVLTEIKDAERTYPTCFYKWENITFSKTKQIGGNEISIDDPTELTIVLVKNATEQMFKTSTSVYKDGQAQNGIGDMAIWGVKMTQLTFLSEGYMIHVNVNMSSVDMENKEIAIKLAAHIIESL